MVSYASSSLEGCNHTELYQLARRAKLGVHPAMSRTELLAVLAGDEEPPLADEADHPFDSWRLGLIGFIADHWAQLEPQLKCPAKMLRHPHHPNPRPCFGCLDAQVVTCVANNARHEALIKLHKGKR